MTVVACEEACELKKCVDLQLHGIRGGLWWWENKYRRQRSAEMAAVACLLAVASQLIETQHVVKTAHFIIQSFRSYFCIFRFKKTKHTYSFIAVFLSCLALNEMTSSEHLRIVCLFRPLPVE